MATEFDVEAEVRLRTGASSGALRGLSDQLGQLGDRIRGTQTIFGGIVRSALAFGASYVGVQAVTHAFRSVVGGAIQFNAELEGTRIGLASVVSAVEGLSFEQATRQSQAAFHQLTDDALRSTATTQELFGIYQQIYGPIRAAGSAIEDVREITNNTVAAASALNVDFNQASRDISAMLRGSAGLDVKLFSMLRSTGAIAEDAEAFNRLTSAERVTRIRAALGRFTVAADAYGRSWAGITSSFKDIVQQLGAKALGPVFESLKKFIGGINERLLRNRSTLEANLEAIGTRVAAVLDRVFGRALDGLDYVLSHWDEIGDRIQHVVERVKALIPHLITAAKIYAGVSIARTMVGGGLQAASVATGAVSMVGQIGGLLGAGGGVAAAGGGAAAAGGAAGGGMAALQGVFASLSAAAGPLAIILIPIVGLITLIADKWEALSEAAAPFIEILSDVGGQFLELLSALWELLKPLLEILGALVIPIIAPFVAVLGLLLIVLKPILWLLTKLVEALAWVAEAVWTQVVEPIVDAFIWLFGEIGKWISNLMGSAEEFRDEYRGEVTEWVDISTAAQEEERRRLEGHATQGQRAPEGRATHVTDMRGSRITVKQEFRDADPDRVAIQMIQDIARQAEQQTTSGFVPAVTR